MAKRFDPKQPSEEYYLRFNFENDIDDETVSLVDSVVAIDLGDGSDVTSTVIDNTKQQNDDVSVYVWAQAGASGRRYKITVQITCSEGSQYELEGILPVFEK